MPKDLLAFRCPTDLIEAIESQIRQTSRSKTDVVIGMLRQSVPSVPLTERSRLPASPAIYFVFTPENKLLYIGRTNNLKRRWDNHHVFQKALDASTEARIGWFNFDDDFLSELDNVEQELINGSEPMDKPAQTTPAPNAYSIEERLQEFEKSIKESISSIAGEVAELKKQELASQLAPPENLQKLGK